MWTTLEIAGKSADVYEPPGDVKPRFGILHLHGVGLELLQHSDAFRKAFDEHQLACICPQGQRSWWTDRICPEFDDQMTAEHFVVHEVLPVFEQRWGIRPRAVGIQGISMGGQGALRIAFKHPKLFPVTAGISSAIEYHEWFGQDSPIDDTYDSKEQCRQDTVPMHVHPSEHPREIFFCIDPTDVEWFRGNDRLHEKLNALGVQHQCDLETQAGGHSWDYFDAMAERTVRFVYEGLERESRRLL